jgi:hypothetical protein
MLSTLQEHRRNTAPVSVVVSCRVCPVPSLIMSVLCSPNNSPSRTPLAANMLPPGLRKRPRGPRPQARSLAKTTPATLTLLLMTWSLSTPKMLAGVWRRFWLRSRTATAARRQCESIALFLPHSLLSFLELPQLTLRSSCFQWSPSSQRTGKTRRGHLCDGRPDERYHQRRDGFWAAVLPSFASPIAEIRVQRAPARPSARPCRRCGGREVQERNVSACSVSRPRGVSRGEPSSG